MEFSHDELMEYMKRCTQLAIKGDKEGIRKPHVGALVISPDKRIIGEGYKKFLDPTNLSIHAERVAITDAGEKSLGSTLVTTLEPCLCPTGRPRSRTIFKPCVELILEAGIKSVVFGDYDDKFKGKGILFLRDNGIDTLKIPLDFYGLGINYCSNRAKKEGIGIDSS